MAVALGDVNGDGKLDIVSTTTSYYYGTGYRQDCAERATRSR